MRQSKSSRCGGAQLLIEAERIEHEKALAEKIAAEKRAEEQTEAARIALERIEAARVEREQLVKEAAEAERRAAEQVELELAARARIEAEQVEREAAERLHRKRLPRRQRLYVVLWSWPKLSGLKPERAEAARRRRSESGC